MKRVELKESGITNLQEFNWVEYFEYNNKNLLKLDFNNNTELSKEEIDLITPSIKAFQLGEGSEGKHLTKVVKNYAQKTGYKDYPEIMKWFIAEENRHSQTLKKFMEVYNIKSVQKLPVDNIFRFLRKLMGIECEIIVLVTAEMVALSYYTALSNATNSTLLKTICAQMLNDELKHVILQSATLHRISKNRNKIINDIIRLIRKILMNLTVFVIGHKFDNLFLKGGYSFKEFKNHCKEYLKESISIEKTGNLQ